MHEASATTSIDDKVDASLRLIVDACTNVDISIVSCLFTAISQEVHPEVG
jgi:hypothetical protein